jgi:WD40 repeat protein
MPTLKTRLAVLITAGVLGLALAPPAPWTGMRAAEPEKAAGVRSDLFGDPLPEGALTRMGTLRWRHGGPVYFVGFNADGKQLVTASLDGSYRIWEVSSGKLLHTLQRPPEATAADPIVRGRRGNIPGGAIYPQASPASVVLSPDRKSLVAPYGDGTVRIWEIATGKEIGKVGKLVENADAKLLAPEGLGWLYASNGLALSADGKTLATRESDHVIRLMDMATGKEIRRLGKAADEQQQSQVPYYGAIGNGLAFSSDGKMLAAMNSTLHQENRGVVTVWDVESGKELQRIQGGPGSLSGRITFAKDTLAVSWADRTLRLYEAATGKELRQLGEKQDNVVINTLAFSPDGKILATRAADSAPSIRLWDVESGKELRHFGELPARVGQSIYISNTGSGNSCATIAFSADGAVLAEALPTNTVRLWDVNSGKEIPLIAGHQGSVSGIAVALSGKTVTTNSPDRTIRRWDPSRGREIGQMRLPEGAGNAVLSADGAFYAYGDAKNVVHLWDATANKEVRAIQVPAQQPLFGPDAGLAGSLALSPDGKFLACKGDDQTIRRYELATGKELTAINLSTTAVASGITLGGDLYNPGLTPLWYSADGAILASLEAPAQEAMQNFLNRRRGNQQPFYVCLWDAATGKLLRAFDFGIGTVAALALSPDSQYLLSADNQHMLTIWEVASGQSCFQIKLKAEAKKKPEAEANAEADAEAAVPATPLVSAVALAPDGRTAAWGAVDRDVHLVDLRNGKEFGRLAGHRGPVFSIAYTADGQTLISGSADGTALVWDISRIHTAVALPAKAAGAQLEALWNDLGGEPAKAYQAIGALSAKPKETLEWVQGRVRPAAGADLKTINKLIADLENDKFDVRQKASEELEKLGELAEPALQKVLDGKPSLETRQRVERILETRRFPQPPSADVLRTLRVMRILAEIGTPEARKLLQTLAEGAPGAAQTREAQAVLNRLKNRPAVVP